MVMTPTLSLSIGSESPRAKVTAVNVLVTQTPDAETAADAEDGILDLGPAVSAVAYYLVADGPAGQPQLRSQVFSPSASGRSTWNSLIFPAAGSWTLRLRNVATDATVATLVVTVTA